MFFFRLIPRQLAAVLVAFFAANVWLAWGYLDPAVPMMPPGRRRVVTVGRCTN